MRTITKEIYTFEELTPEVQQKVIDNNRDWNTDYDWWDFAYDEIAEMWKKKGIGTDDHKKGNGPFYFDLGRGSIFYATGAYIDDYGSLFEALELDMSSEKADDILNNVKFDVQHFGGNSAKTIVESDYLTDEDAELIQELVDGLCQESLLLLQREYDYLTSDEAIRESIIANEAEFYWDGRPA